jgi:signal peptidase I
VGGTLVAATAAVLGAAALGLLLRRLLVFVTEVESWSMAPALVPGQRVLTRRLLRGERVRRGDVLVVMSAELGRAVVKRVVGLPGERVEIDRHGRVRIDGTPLAEGYVAHAGGASAGAFAVPEGHLLLLGDNRARSSDSRGWSRPFLPVTAVRGRVVTRVRAGDGEDRGRVRDPLVGPGPGPRGAAAPPPAHGALRGAGGPPDPRP